MIRGTRALKAPCWRMASPAGPLPAKTSLGICTSMMLLTGPIPSVDTGEKSGSGFAVAKHWGFVSRWRWGRWKPSLCHSWKACLQPGGRKESPDFAGSSPKCWRATAPSMTCLLRVGAGGRLVDRERCVATSALRSLYPRASSPRTGFAPYARARLQRHRRGAPGR